jgi:hypothetical protein
MSKKDNQNKEKKRKVEDYSEVMKTERASDNFFRSFIPKPRKISLDIQDKDEKIVLVLRQHPITQVKGNLTLLFLAIIIPFLLSISGITELLPQEFIAASSFFGIIILFGLFTRAFLIWFFNVYIITDERIIDVDFNSMIFKNISSAKIENIEDITTRTMGPMASVFDFGTILIQTAGEQTEFEFDHVPQPAKVTKLLNELILEEEREKIEGRAN